MNRPFEAARPALAGLALAVALSCAPLRAAHAAEITLYQSALQTAVDREVFAGSGRRVLSGDPRGCAFALVEQPAVTLRDGRLNLRARFVARVGVRNGKDCAGSAEDFWFQVSGKPVAQGDALQLVDLQVNEIKAFYRPLIETLMAGPVAQAVRVNLRTELQKILGGVDAYRVSVPRLDIQSVTTSDEAVTMAFDFRLEAR